jgi:acetylornithine deacetylase
MKHYQKMIHEWLNVQRKNGIRLLTQLVQQASTQGNEAKAQAIVVEKCRQLGLEIDIWEPDGEKLREHPYFISPRTDFSNSPNVVGILRGTGGGRSLILNSHIDVVPEGEVEQWEDEPYSGAIKGGKVYGRGASDTKGGTVSFLLALEAIKAVGIRLKGDVIFQSVVEEESGGAGTLAAILRGYKADGAIITEPTNMKLFPKQQGSLWFRITVHGKSAHGGTRYEGVSAIEKVKMVLEQLQELELERNARVVDPLFQHISIPVPINVGKIEGGTWPSSVPDRVVIEGRMGVAPNETVEMAKQEMEHCVSVINQSDNWFQTHPVELEWFGAQWLPSSIDENHPLVAVLADAYKRVKGETPTVEASPWGTDGGLLSQVGQIPTIVFGPGTTAVAHHPNEYIEIDNMLIAAEILALTIIHWCEIDEAGERTS